MGVTLMRISLILGAVITITAAMAVGTPAVSAQSSGSDSGRSGGVSLLLIMFIGWLIWGAVPAFFCTIAAPGRNRSPILWFFLGSFFGWLGLLAILVAGKVEKPDDDLDDDLYDDLDDPASTPESAPPSPLSILQARFARGEISEEEYERMRATLTRSDGGI